MPKVTSGYVPKYRKHQATGQARVEIDGATYYLGPWKSKASYLEYDRLINEWLANGRRMPTASEQLTLSEVMAAYVKFARSYYRKQPSGYHEKHRIADALKPLRELYGKTPADEFGPKRLKAARQKMLAGDLCRKQINTQVGRIKRMFKWAVSEELIPASVHQALATVEGLKRGRTDARESKPVKPIDEETVQRTYAYMPPVVADMVRLQRLTGCRPGEICQLRPADLDRSSDVWIFSPESHKTQHHGRDRTIFIGPKGQGVLTAYLLRPDWEYCFSPKDSEARRRFLATEARKTPLSYGNGVGTNRKTKPKRSIGMCYTNDSYRRAIHRAVEKANKGLESGEAIVEKWSPNRLRHSAATEIRSKFGLEAAQVCLGHAAADVTQIYAERDLEKAREIMSQIG